MAHVTPVALYRMGNASSPRMDHVRPQDIETFDADGEKWVQAGTGGISTGEFEGSLAGRWWRLDAGYDYGPLLLVWNDYARHWSWEPALDMRLAAFQAMLRASHPFFVRAWV